VNIQEQPRQDLVSDSEYEFKRIVAVEYPRPGMWTIAFVTGEGLLDVQTAAGEQILAVLIPRIRPRSRAIRRWCGGAKSLILT